MGLSNSPLIGFRALNNSVPLLASNTSTCIYDLASSKAVAHYIRNGL